jgi:hypothetical protein
MRYTPQRRLGVLVALAALGGPGALPAQEPAGLERGDRVRVTAPQAGLVRAEASFEALSADSLVLAGVQLRAGTAAAPQAFPRLAVARDQVGDLELRVATRRHTRAGARVGVVVGGLAGVAYGLSTPVRCHWAADWLFSLSTVQCVGAVGGTTSWVLVHALLGGGSGALLGGAIGWLTRTDSWRKVPLQRMRPIVDLLPNDRLGLGIAIGF